MISATCASVIVKYLGSGEIFSKGGPPALRRRVCTYDNGGFFGRKIHALAKVNSCLSKREFRDGTMAENIGLCLVITVLNSK